jgi:hypothetical protein
MSFCFKASAIQMEIGQWIPWNYLNQSFEKSIAAKTHFKTDAFVTKWQDLNPQVSGLEFEIRNQLIQAQFSEKGFDFNLHGNSVERNQLVIRMGRSLIDQTIFREFGGNQMALRIKAECSSFEIRAEGVEIRASAPFEFINGQWLPVIQDLAISVDSPVAVTEIYCSGPMGLDLRITDLVRQSLGDQNVLRKILKAWVNQWVQENLESSLQQVLSSAFPEAKLERIFPIFREGFFLSFNYSHPVGDPNELLQLPSDLLEQPQDWETPQLILSEAAINRLIELEVAAQKGKAFNLQNIPAFARLMKKRLIQFFVWSDLLHYSRNAPFYLNLKQVVSKDIRMLGQGQWQLQLQAQGNIESHRKQKKWSYIEWAMGLATKIRLKIENNQLVIDTENSVSQLHWRFGNAYEKEFSPSGLSGKILKRAIEGTVRQQRLLINLPKLELNREIWSFDHVQFETERIWIKWKVAQ